MLDRPQVEGNRRQLIHNRNGQPRLRQIDGGWRRLENALVGLGRSGCRTLWCLRVRFLTSLSLLALQRVNLQQSIVAFCMKTVTAPDLLLSVRGGELGGVVVDDFPA